jgi:hypothetical protein
MTNRMIVGLCIVIGVVAMPVFANTQATNTTTVSPTLKVNVTVQDAIQLTLATGTQCVLAAGGGADYNMSFGNVDALAITAVTCGAKFAPITPGTTNAAYYSDYTLTPVFTSQLVSTNTITSYVSTNFVKANLSIVQSNVLPVAIGNLTPMSLLVGAQTNTATNAVSGTSLTRYIGVSIAPTNGAGLQGADSAIITYTLTVA